jgi:hypothetical protein
VASAIDHNFKPLNCATVLRCVGAGNDTDSAFDDADTAHLFPRLGCQLRFMARVHNQKELSILRDFVMGYNSAEGYDKVWRSPDRRYAIFRQYCASVSRCLCHTYFGWSRPGT